MRFIDKTANRAPFDAYTRDYLHASQAPGGHSFIPNLESKIAYENFSQRRWKYQRLNPQIPFDGWLEILETESDRRCCYCMRRLQSSEISVEHLIPENFTRLNEDEEIEFYEKYAPYLRDNVISGRKFDLLARQGLVDIDAIQRMPHLVAHANLFPACLVEIGCACNNHRGNRRILPMMLMPDVISWTDYTPEGLFRIYHSDIDASATVLEALELNSPTLVKIRRLWYLFSRKNLYLQDGVGYSIAEKDNMLRNAFGLNDEEAVLPEGFDIFLTDSHYWDLMLKYDWFFRYYLTAYPIDKEAETKS